MFYIFFKSLFLQTPAQNWKLLPTGGNWASHRVLATKSTSFVILVMSWWVLRAGFVRRAWPGAASRRLAEVSVPHRYLPVKVTLSLHLTKSPVSDLCVSLCSAGAKITAQLHLLCSSSSDTQVHFGHSAFLFSIRVQRVCLLPVP